MHKINPIYVLLLSIVLLSGKAEATGCKDGWTAHKDEQCVKIFTTNLLTYEEARIFCSSQGSEVSKASLVMIKDKELQEFLANYTSDAFEFLCLGGKYDEETAQFRWDDGEPLTYTNWQEGHPRNYSSSSTCIKFRPRNANVSSTDADGKWAAVVCQKRNLVMCQRDSTWTLQDAIGEIINLRKELQSTKQDLQAVDSRVVPVGSIYIEYFNQPSPTSLWPNLAWQDIASTYEGLFFRASGASSGSWGDTQTECAPRITQMRLALFRSSADVANPLNVPASGWSQYGHAGYWWSLGATGSLHYEGLKFYTEDCEVRPKNQAIRIWKRTA